MDNLGAVNKSFVAVSASLLIMALAAAASACGGGGEPTGPPSGPGSAAEAVTGTSGHITLRGTLTVDGESFAARSLGARVRRDGLVAPCQVVLSGVTGGAYEIDVLADSEVIGCGASGARIFLWTVVHNEQLYSLEELDWPGDGAEADFHTMFSTSSPEGVAPAMTDFRGPVRTSSGALLPPGTLVEAYVGDVLCGVTSIRQDESFFLTVVGPDGVPGCEAGATLSFYADGDQALETAINDPAESGGLDLTLP